MTKKRLITLGVLTIAIVGMAVLTLSVLTGTSEAQGPGGGRGQGGRGGQGIGTAGTGQGLGTTTGNGTQNQYSTSTRQQSQSFFVLPPAVPGPVPDDVVAALNAGLMDEYNAYATYQAVIDQFGAVRPFTTIQASESTHIAALTNLFDRYGLPVPAAQPLATVPQFATLADACATGAAAEVANFGLYDQWLATVQDYPDMTQVFTALRAASEFQHLPAFERCAGL